MDTQDQLASLLTQVIERLDAQDARIDALTGGNQTKPEPTTKKRTTRKPTGGTTRKPSESKAPKAGERVDYNPARKAISDRLANLQRPKGDPHRKNAGGVIGKLSKRDCRALLDGDTLEVTNRAGGTWVVAVR